jgi:uncharacterized protein
MTIDPRLHRIVAAQPYPLLFATISGAHLYGFPSPDSDFDLRGVHLLPLESVVGLEVQNETVQQEMIVEDDAAGRAEAHSEIASASAGELRRDGLRPDVLGGGRRLEMDIVSHDVKKFFGLLLKKNGYVLEQLFSPLIVHTTPEHAELKEICCPHPQPLSRRTGEGGVGSTSPHTGVITKHHSHHYFGFSETQWKLFEKERPRRVKPLLYVYRVLLTGIYLMRTGVINANLVELNEEARLPYIADLIARKQSGENTALEDADVAFHQSEYERLRIELQAAHDASQLPEVPSDETRQALNDLLVRIRMGGRR